jgi:hypothetical protein
MVLIGLLFCCLAVEKEFRSGAAAELPPKKIHQLGQILSRLFYSCAKLTGSDKYPTSQNFTIFHKNLNKNVIQHTNVSTRS